jgi:hypothetical protein
LKKQYQLEQTNALAWKNKHTILKKHTSLNKQIHYLTREPVHYESVMFYGNRTLCVSDEEKKSFYVDTSSYPAAALRRRPPDDHRRQFRLDFFPNPDRRRPTSGSPAPSSLSSKDKQHQVSHGVNPIKLLRPSFTNTNKLECLYLASFSSLVLQTL